ncbi:MAG: glycosyltransferase family 10 [Patescibacteria group bacterium]
MKQIVYFVPFSEQGLENKLFTPYFNPKANVPPFTFLKSFLKEHDIEVLTIDFLKDKPADNDMIIVFDHPPVGIYKILHRLRDLVFRKNTFPIKNRRLLKILPQFSKKVLVQWESPVNNPWVYKNIKSIVRRYDKSYFIPKASGFPHFHYPQNFNSLNEEHFNNSSRKFLIMMNSRMKAKGFWKQELYSERGRALEFFSQYDEVDLYGSRWNADPSPAIKKIWKGFADDKPKTMSEYKFALCFENAIWPGYVTEKIFDCMAVGAIPIYWGAPDIEDDVSVGCFIDMRKFKNYEELRNFLRALTSDQIENYRKAICVYFNSEKFKKFTPQYFFETILKIIKDEKNN